MKRNRKEWENSLITPWLTRLLFHFYFDVEHELAQCSLGDWEYISFVAFFSTSLSGANWTRIPLKTCLMLTVMSRALASKHRFYRFHLFVGFTCSLGKPPEQFIGIDFIKNKNKKKKTWCLCWGADAIFGHTSHLKYVSGVLCHVSQPICSSVGWPTVSICLGQSQCVSVVQVSFLLETFSRQKRPLLDSK